MKIAILVGHGKSDNGKYDSGAVNRTLTPKRLIHEFSIARQIANSAAIELNGFECEVELVNFNGDKNLKERIAYCNQKGYDLIVEMHLNAFTTKTARGTEAYYYPKDNIGQAIADRICKAIAKDLNIPQRSNGIDDGGDKASTYYGIVRQTKGSAVLVETCFITTDSELIKVDELAEQQKLGKVIGQAIAKTLKLEKAKLDTPKYQVRSWTYPSKEAAEVAKNEILALGHYCKVEPLQTK